MTLGDKIRRARKECGLSQERLADRLAVSRSAVAKWETDKGLPDVGNLKLLARLLGVSVDHLLDEEEPAQTAVIREAYCLAAYGQGCKKVKKDRFVLERFPDAKIYTLFARQERPDPAAFADKLSDCCAEVQETADKAFYLVEYEERRLLATVTDTHIELRNLELEGNQFQIDGWSFIKCNYELTM